jgi:hypothetical protein
MAKDVSGGGSNPELGRFPDGHAPEAPGKLPSRRLDERAPARDWVTHLGKLDLPAERDELVKQARAHGMDDELIEVLQRMPEKQYGSLDEVSRILGREPW